MSRARTAAKQPHPARLREEQMCEVAATGLGRLLCIAFPLMTTTDASVEALRYVRAGMAGSARTSAATKRQRLPARPSRRCWATA